MEKNCAHSTGLEVIKLFSCSTQLSPDKMIFLAKMDSMAVFGSDN